MALVDGLEEMRELAVVAVTVMNEDGVSVEVDRFCAEKLEVRPGVVVLGETVSTLEDVTGADCVRSEVDEASSVLLDGPVEEDSTIGAEDEATAVLATVMELDDEDVVDTVLELGTVRALLLGRTELDRATVATV